MKLSLRQQRDVQILTAHGELDAHQVQVLRAGVTKLFRSGKNRVILELDSAPKLDSEVLRALSELNFLARELSGQITLAGVSKEVRARIESFAQPPFILSYESTEKALEAILAPPDEPSKGAAPLPDAGMLGDLKSKLAENQSGEIADLRRENVELKKQLDAQARELIALAEKRKAPVTAGGYDERIAKLERELASALDKLKEASAKA